MARRNVLPPLRSGGSLWGPERVAAGIPLKALAEEARINPGFISRMEHGRMIPTSDEFRRVMDALDRLKAGRAGVAGGTEG